MLVCSDDGLDEVSLSAPTQVREVVRGEVRSWTWTPEDFGLATCTLESLRAADAEASAKVIAGVLQGEASAAARVTLANAAAGLLAAERVTSLREGVVLAQDAIASGRARNVLEKLRACHNDRDHRRPVIGLQVQNARTLACGLARPCA